MNKNNLKDDLVTRITNLVDSRKSAIDELQILKKQADNDDMYLYFYTDHERSKVRTYDHAVPLNVVREITKVTGKRLTHCIYGYGFDNRHGFIPLSERDETILDIHKHLTGDDYKFQFNTD